MPTKTAILSWPLYTKALGKRQIRRRYSLTNTRAREVQTDCMADDIISIADDSQYDTITEDGKTITNIEHIQRDRLRVDARKWLASTLRPKKYGDKSKWAAKPSFEVEPFFQLRICDVWR